MSPIKQMQDVFKIKRVKALAVCAVVCAAFFFMTIDPSYAVRVSLKRVVFDSKQRSEILTIINNSGKPQTYRLGWRKYKMDPDSSLRAVEDGSADAQSVLWADDMIRFAPRRVTIPPGGSQQVRLLFRRPKDLQDAEYRSHLWIVSESDTGSFSADPNQENTIKLAVQPAISLPVFVRVGELSAEASIAEPSFTRTQDGMTAKFRLNRTGTRSIYGDLDFVCTDHGENLILHQVRGIAVYTEIDHRNLSFKLPSSPGVNTCTNVQVIYRADPGDADFNGEVMATATGAVQ